MEKKYINESRYKKSTTRKRRDTKTVKANLSSKKENTKQIQVKEKTNLKKDTNAQIKTNPKIKPSIVKKRKRVKKSNKKSNRFNIIVCILLLIAIAIISRAILKEDNEPFIPFTFGTNSNDEVIQIGVITDEDLNNTNINNLVINEINKYSKDILLKVNEDYSITYGCLSNVNKVSNTEYILTKKEKSNITINEIKSSIEKYKEDKDSIYYSNLLNISNITIIDENNLKITLKNQDPYFIYKLDVSLNSNKDVTNYVQDATSNNTTLIFNRHEDADSQLPAKIVLKRYKDMYATVEAYKDKEINMFVTNAENVENILGKYEYNIKTYRNGQNLFLFANPKSKTFSRSEVRQAIAYGIDRESIIESVLNKKGLVIDLPYIYNETKYKYDVYAAENLLLTNEYKKVNKVYTKTEKGSKILLELDLIVNKEDSIKVAVANKIKNNLSAIGIKVNVEKLTEAKLKTRMFKGQYDLVLANVNLNNIPDVSFVKNNLYLTEDTNKQIENISKSNITELANNITILQNLLSENVSTIGIYSDVSYLVYSKEIVDIQNISYLNIFKTLFN